jgi:hypothetical protein
VSVILIPSQNLPVLTWITRVSGDLRAAG